MRSTLLSTLLVLSLAACGGSKQEAKAPTTDSADVPRDGSPTPGADVSVDPPVSKAEPVKTTAVSNTADGSDIIPPFTADKKQDAPAAKSTKKKKPKKKG